MKGKRTKAPFAKRGPPLPKKNKQQKRKNEEDNFDQMDVIVGNNTQQPTHDHKKKKKKEDLTDVIATVKLRQKSNHKKSLYYLEQLILKHKIHDMYSFDVKEVSHGCDFLFYKSNEASKFIDFIKSLLPVFVTQNKDSENFKMELCQVTKYDVVCLPPGLYNSMGNFGPIIVCFKVNTSLYFIDPNTLMAGEVNTEQFFHKEKSAFKPLFQTPPVKYLVMDIEKLYDQKNGGFQLARVQVCKESEIGIDNQGTSTMTHLGNILQPGDLVFGYDLKNANLNDENLESYKQIKIPDVILTRKYYERPNKRFWLLRKWKIEREDDYEEFLDELEEDKEMRSKINLYKDNNMKMDTDEHEKKLKNIPHVSLEELLDNLKL